MQLTVRSGLPFRVSKIEKKSTTIRIQLRSVMEDYSFGL